MKKRLFITVTLFVYVVILVNVMVFKDVPLIRMGPVTLDFGGTHDGPANLIPFKTIGPYLLGEKGFMIAFINIAGNILLLVPIGFLVPFVYRNVTWKKMLALAIASGMTLEGMQALFRVGIFDIDDVILNGLGVITGYWSFTVLAKKLPSMKTKTKVIASVTALVIAIAASLFSISFLYKRQPRVDTRRGVENMRPVQLDKKEAATTTPTGPDPCNGTGGTGQIVSIGNKLFTIMRNDGINQTINISDQTLIKNSRGALAVSDLKTGDRVTVVVMPNDDGIETATVVLVCNTSRIGK